MKNIILYSTFIAITSIFLSCSSVYIIGNDFNEIRVQDISIGETKVEQIINMFGEPLSKGLLNQYEVFTYSYEEYEFPPKRTPSIHVDRNVKSLIIVFDENGNVLKYAYNLPMGTSLDMLMMDREQKRDQDENTNNVNY